LPIRDAGNGAGGSIAAGNGAGVGSAEVSGADVSSAGTSVDDHGVSEIGAALFALVARAREAGLDPELELRAAARSYRERVRRWATEKDRDPA
jgi:hypothetical protein